MRTEHIKLAIIGGWIVALAIYAFAVNLTSIGGWAFLVAFGVIPAAVMLRIWNPPAKTMSQNIQEALEPPGYPNNKR
jgi:hypothetical protein